MVVAVVVEVVLVCLEAPVSIYHSSHEGLLQLIWRCAWGVRDRVMHKVAVFLIWL